MSTTQALTLEDARGNPIIRVIPAELSSATTLAISATVATLYVPVTGERALHTSPAALLPLSISPPPLPIEDHLTALTAKANAAANAAACGSILAGRSSESDEFGDVAFWLGEGQYGQGRERDVLRALDLETGLGPNIKVTSMEVSRDTRLPSATASLGESNEGKELRGLLSKWKDVHAFTVEPIPAAAGTVAHFLVGRYEEGGHGWVGLVGMGVQT